MAADVLDGKVAAVTGGSGRLDDVAGRIRARTGRDVRWVAGDLTESDGFPAQAAAVWDAFGRIDIVVNSAVPPSKELAVGDLLGTPEPTWWQMFDPIVLGALRLGRELAPRMAAEWGRFSIRANALSPGLSMTLGRYGRPADLVGCVVFLVSDAASFISDAVLPVDGGRF